MSQTPPDPQEGQEPTQPYAQQPPPSHPQPTQGYSQGYPQAYPQGYPPPPGQPGYPAYAGPVAPEHHQATTVLVLGILGLLLCQVLSPFAWVMGNRVVREIDAGGGRVGGRSAANAGRICGIVGTVLIGIALALVVLVLGTAVLGALGTLATS